MKTYQNEQGQTVYRLEAITDLVLLPESEIDGALKSLELMIRSLRVMHCLAEEMGGDALEEFKKAFVPYVDWVADDRNAFFLRDGSNANLMSVELKQESDNAAKR